MEKWGFQPSIHPLMRYTKLMGFVLFFHFANPLKTDMCLHLLSVFGKPLTPFDKRFFETESVVKTLFTTASRNRGQSLSAG